MGKIDFLKIVLDHPELVRMGFGCVPDMFWTILGHFRNADVCKITVWADFEGRFSRDPGRLDTEKNALSNRAIISQTLAKTKWPKMLQEMSGTHAEPTRTNSGSPGTIFRKPIFPI